MMFRGEGKVKGLDERGLVAWAATKDGNYTACTKWGVAKQPGHADVLYLLDVIRIQVELPDVREFIKMQDKLDKPDLIVIDGLGVGIGLYQDLRRLGFAHLVHSAKLPDSPMSAPKIERFGRTTFFLYDGSILLPTAAPWLSAFINELASFPNGKYDDQVDSMTQLVYSIENVLLFARQKRRPPNL
jgi:predicted phage terminase large subunit-like protein